MVRSDGKPYRKASQKGPRGGKTRREQLRDKLQRKRRRLREKGLEEIRFHVKPIAKRVDNSGGAQNDYAVYGIYKDGTKWVLTGLSATDSVEKMNNHRGGGYSRTEVRGRYVMAGRGGDVDPEAGVEIDRFDTKKAALSYVSADGSNRVEPGKYVVRPRHDPRSRLEEVDKDDFRRFTRDAIKVWE